MSFLVINPCVIILNRCHFLLQKFIDEFPRNQSMYDHVYDLLDNMIEICMIFVSQGHQADQFMPENLLDTAGNLVDIISSDLDSLTTSSEYPEDILSRRQTIQDTIDLIDKIMILVFSVSILHVYCKVFLVGLWWSINKISKTNLYGTAYKMYWPAALHIMCK